MPNRLTLCCLLLCSVAAGDPPDLDAIYVGADITLVDHMGEVVRGRRVVKQGGRELRMPPAGAVVTNVIDGGPADQAGLAAMDVITKFGDAEATDRQRFVAAMKTVDPGTAVPIRVEKFAAIESDRSRWLGRYKTESAAITPLTIGQYAESHMTLSALPEVQGVLCTHQDAPHPTGPTGFDVRYVKSANVVAPGIVVRYRGGDWLFWTSATILIDDETFVFEVGHFKPKREVLGGSTLSEWSIFVASDVNHGETVTKVLGKLLNAKSATLVLEGDAYRTQHKLSDDELTRARVTVVAAMASGWAID